MANETKGVFTLQDVRDRNLDPALDGIWPRLGYNRKSYAWYMSPGSSGVNRYDFTTETDSSRGPISSTRSQNAGVSNATDGWFGGNDPVGTQVDRVIFSTDLGTGVAKGGLARGRRALSAMGNVTDAWFVGGNYDNVPLNRQSSVDRIIYASDTANAVAKGDLTAGPYWCAAFGNTTDGWVAGGAGLYPGGTPGSYENFSYVQRIIFASDTATPVTKGNLAQVTWRCGGSSPFESSTSGYVTGGTNGVDVISTVTRVTFSSDTATSVNKGPLTSVNQYNTSAGSPSSLWVFFGGPLTAVNRIIFATDTATATSRGPTTSSGYYKRATNGAIS